MNKGCLLFAHNSSIDYGSQAVLAARLATKNLGVPVSLVTDSDTTSNLNAKFDKLPFDQIIIVDKPQTSNRRYLGNTNIEFINSNRVDAYSLTPYDRTLIIDTDFLILSDVLGNYWNDPHDFLITPKMQCPTREVNHPLGQYTIDMLWATNIMFSKTEETKILFDLVDYIKQEYKYYSHLYEFSNTQFRNDFVFSVACHIMSAHGLSKWQGDLPVPLLYDDVAEIISIKPEGQITFLVQDLTKDKNYLLSKCYQQDVHVMNKHSILDNLDRLLELA